MPSDGSPVNPQLFREADSAASPSKKRKISSQNLTEQVSQEISFFKNGANASQHAHQRDPKDLQPQATPSTSDGNDAPQLCLEDRKKVLKSHKIKVTDLHSLSQLGAQPAGKRPKRGKPEIVTSRKRSKEASRLYPQPLTSFVHLKFGYGISKTLFDNISEQGYYEPTEVQLAGLPLLLGGVEGVPSRDRVDSSQAIDLLTVAPTGSGKTLAFLIPLIHNIMSARKQERHVSALILAPTKELVNQIVAEGRRLCAKTGVHITAMRKGMTLTSQSCETTVDEEDDGEGSNLDDVDLKTNTTPLVKSDIIVSTPLSLSNALSDTPLPNVDHLILDEADVLLDPLFRDQTMSVWTSCTNPSLRTSFWSATIGSSIEDLVKSTLTTRQSSLSTASTSPLIRLVIGLKDTSLPNITHRLIYAATEPGKLLGLRQLLHPPSSTTLSTNKSKTSTTTTQPILRPPFLVFTQTIPRAIALHAELRYDIPLPAGGSSRIAVLHSDLSDTARAEIMTRFRKAQIWVLITTDLLSRGIDFRGVNGVVNYDIPTSSAGYVHRAGRTGRAGREGGVVVTFYTKDDIPYVKNVANVIAASEKLRKTEEGNSGAAQGGHGEGIQKWLLQALPDVSKRDRQRLKRRGVEARRPATTTTAAGRDGKGDKEKRKARISTKPGYERRLEQRRKGAVEGSQNRKEREETMGGNIDGGEDSGWEGFED